MSLHAATDFAQVVAACEDCEMIAVDMPIALPAEGVRESDHALRAHLGAAARSLFWTPTRSTLEAATHAEAVTANHAAGGKGPSIQGWGLMPKVREIRHELQTQHEDQLTQRVREVHPESTFVTMARLSGLATPLASKKSAAGVGQRLGLLAEHCNFEPAALTAAGKGTGVDDCLDAAAAAWTAWRIVSGTAVWFGPNETDDQGFVLGVPT